MLYRERGRTSEAFSLNGSGSTTYGGSVLSTQSYSLTRTNAEYMKDKENSLWSNPRLREKWGPLLNLGSPMDLLKVRFEFPISGDGAGNSPANSIRRRYDGPVIAFHNAPADLHVPSRALTYASADPLDVRFGLGGQAIAACRPAQPEASFGQFLVELYREGVPSLFQRLDFRDRVEFFRGLGGNYLNVEFGWKPFVADLRSTLNALMRAEAIIDDLYKHNNQFIRRRYSFPDIQTVNVQTDNVYPWPTLTTAHWSQNGRTTTDTKTKKTWFSGEFKYRLPDRGSYGRELRVKARHVLGADITPELLWNVTPWSWFLDWFGSIGDLLANASAISSDNLVMHYGYLMQEVEREIKYTHLGVRTLGYGSVNSTVSGRVLVTHKTRCLASPYGFGLKPGDLTARQWAILVAMGLVKNPGGIPYQNG